MEKSERIIYKREKGNFLAGIILLTIGVIFLLNNFGLVDWSVWKILFKFWPVLFILWGLDTMAEDTLFTKIIFTIAGILLIGFVVTYALIKSNVDFRYWVFRNCPSLYRLEENFDSKVNMDRNFNNWFYEDKFFNESFSI